jgi:hypothetical protein
MLFIFVAGLTFNMWEYFPQNALLMLLWGIVLGTGYQANSGLLPLKPMTGKTFSALLKIHR